MRQETGERRPGLGNLHLAREPGSTHRDDRVVLLQEVHDRAAVEVRDSHHGLAQHRLQFLVLEGLRGAQQRHQRPAA